MFIMTSGCNETVTDGTMAGLAITLFTADSASGFTLLGNCADVDVDGVGFVTELLVDGSPGLLSLSTSMLSFVAVTGIMESTE